MKEIPATKGYVALVDDEDFERLSQHRWYAHNSAGGKRPASRTPKDEGRKVIPLVHHILKAPAGLVVDHINGDPWDNRRANLRVCTQGQNSRNQHRKPRGSLLKGVQVRRNRFGAMIRSNGATFDLGSYATPEEAAAVYDAAALALNGEFACLNFPDAGTKPRHPTVIRSDWKAVSDPLSRGGEAAAEVVRLIGEGHTAASAAQLVGVPHWRACSWARWAGVKLPRGRPRNSNSAVICDGRSRWAV